MVAFILASLKTIVFALFVVTIILGIDNIFNE